MMTDSLTATPAGLDHLHGVDKLPPVSHYGEPSPSRFHQETRMRPLDSYDPNEFRSYEYPILKNETYLDHAGTALYPTSVLLSFFADLSSNLYGNPHSQSRSSSLATDRVEEVRLRVLEFFNANPEDFDIIFTQNTTAAAKLVAEILRCSKAEDVDASQGPPSVDTTEHNRDGFWYGYHIESHTSLIGLRELAEAGHACFEDDDAVEHWLKSGSLNQGNIHKVGAEKHHTMLLCYPGQSNMTGRRLPLSWAKKLRDSPLASNSRVFTLLDAAALVSTGVLDLGNAKEAPDFTTLSFYKIFGFPDLGGLIVRRSIASVLKQRRYFGGGTVEAVINSNISWHATRGEHPHDYLEDGTLPFHNIMALGHAMSVHKRLYGSQKRVSDHTTKLAKYMYDRLSTMCHDNGNPVCVIYHDTSRGRYGDSTTQGPILSFNIKDVNGRWVRLVEVDTAANKQNIHLRTGDVCNPGGVARSLDLSTWELFRKVAGGIRCGCKNIMIGGQPNGIARVSLGAMSSVEDVNTFINFIDRTYRNLKKREFVGVLKSPCYINVILVYPLYGCGAWRVPNGVSWNVKDTGLEWNSEWCLVDTENRSVLDQGRFPQLLLIRPEIECESGVLKIKLHRTLGDSAEDGDKELQIPLEPENPDSEGSNDTTSSPTVLFERWEVKLRERNTLQVEAYLSQRVVSFFSAALKIPCTIARIQDANATTETPLFGALSSKAWEEKSTYTALSDTESQSPGASSQLANGVNVTAKDKGLPQPPQQIPESVLKGWRNPHEVVAESMGANLILADIANVEKPRLSQNWQFLRWGRKHTSKETDESYYIARQATDNLLTENLRVEAVDDCPATLKKIVCEAGKDAVRIFQGQGFNIR